MNNTNRIISCSILLLLYSIQISSISGQSIDTRIEFSSVILDSLIINGFSAYSDDINGDGLTDYACTNSDSGISIYFQSPNGSFEKQFFSPDTFGIYNLQISNFYNSEFSQIIYSSIYSGLNIITISDSNTFSSENISESIKWNFDLGDLNQDGLIDIVGNSDGLSTELQVLYQTSPGFFEESTIDIESGYGYGLCIIDYDRDGDLDIVASVVNGFDQVLFYENVENENYVKHILLSNTPGILDFDLILVDTLSYYDIYYVSNPTDSPASINLFRYGYDNQVLATGMSQLWTISAANLDIDSDIEIVSAERDISSLFYLDYMDGNYESIPISDDIQYVSDIKIIPTQNSDSPAIVYVAGNSIASGSFNDTCSIGIVTINETFADSTFLLYTFNDFGVDTVYDGSFNGNDGLLYNIDHVDSYAGFSDSSYVEVNSEYYRLLKSELLIEILFSPLLVDQRASLISCFDSGGYEVFLESNNIHTRFVIGQDTIHISSTVNVIENTWNHVAISLVENQITMFLNYQHVESIYIDGQIRYGDANRLLLGQSCVQGLSTNSQYFGLVEAIKISAINYSIEEFINYEPSSIVSPNRMWTFSAYPNPFNPSTTIQYELPEPLGVSLTIYDIAGRTVTTLVDKTMQLGHYEVRWNGTTASGNQVAAGMYFARLQTGTHSNVVKMVYLQ